MFDIRIENAPNALRLMQQCWPTCIISLVGDDLRFELPQKGPHHFIARFHDVERAIAGYIAPDMETLRAGLEHARKLDDGARLLIHCHAGKSRSPAMALGILVAAGLGPEKAMAKVQSLRPFIIPNRLMISILDEILDQQGELMRVVLKHYALLPADASLPDRGGWNL